MKKIVISDVTLRQNGAGAENCLSFKEKIEVAKQLDRIGVDTIETPKIENVKADTLLLHTLSAIVNSSVISCPVDLNGESVVQTWEAIKSASKKRLHVIAPVSPVQMEYVSHKKPAKMLEVVSETVAACKALCDEVEFTACDATRAEPEFLAGVISAAIKSGANVITVSDAEGNMLPCEYESFIKNLYTAVPELRNVTLSVECSDKLDVGTACTYAAVAAGAVQIKTAVVGRDTPSITSVANVLKLRGDSVGIVSNLNFTTLEHGVKQITTMFTAQKGTQTAFDNSVREHIFTDVTLNKNDDIKTVSEYIKKLGYDLSEEDMGKVYESFARLASKKEIGVKELDAIVANSAMQVPPTYKLVSYVINSGNIIAATANIVLEKLCNPLWCLLNGKKPAKKAAR